MADETDGPKTLDWKIVLEIVGAAAGIAALMTLFGGALLWVRFDALGLPADRAVALLPRTLLLTIGAHHLLVSALVGLLAVIAIFTAHPERRPRWVVAAVLVAMVGLAVAGVAFLLDASTGILVGATVLAVIATAAYAGRRLVHHGDEWDNVSGWLPTVLVLGVAVVGVQLLTETLDVVPHRLIIGGVTVAAILAIAGTVSQGRNRPTAWVVFLAFLFVGGAVALARTANLAKMEPVAILLKSPHETLAGFYIGETSDRVFVAPLPGAEAPQVSGEDVKTIVAVSRDRVVRTLLREPAGLDDKQGGREDVQTLLRELLTPSTPEAPASPVHTADPVTRFAPLVHVNSDEKVPPTSVDYFLKRAWVAFAHGAGCPPWGFAQKRHAPAAKLQSKQPIDVQDLGHGGYHHHAGCNHDGPNFTSRQYTRPFSGARPKGLGEAEGFYLDLDDDSRTPKPKLSKRGRQTLLGGVPVYYEMHPEHGATKSEHDPSRITYWFFYPASVPPGLNRVARIKRAAQFFVHEGDWERISVLISPGPADNEWTPQSVRFHEHDGYEELPWAQVRKATDERGSATHPIAYSALGSHATYPKPGKYPQVLRAGDTRVIEVQDDAHACLACPEWLTWQSLIDAEPQGWYGFGGAWGGVGGSRGTTGPLGPSDYKTRGLAPAPNDALGRAAIHRLR